MPPKRKREEVPTELNMIVKPKCYGFKGQHESIKTLQDFTIKFTGTEEFQTKIFEKYKGELYLPQGKTLQDLTLQDCAKSFKVFDFTDEEKKANLDAVKNTFLQGIFDANHSILLKIYVYGQVSKSEYQKITPVTQGTTDRSGADTHETIARIADALKVKFSQQFHCEQAATWFMWAQRICSSEKDETKRIDLVNAASHPPSELLRYFRIPDSRLQQNVDQVIIGNTIGRKAIEFCQKELKELQDEKKRTDLLLETRINHINDTLNIWAEQSRVVDTSLREMNRPVVTPFENALEARIRNQPDVDHQE
jgi:hypothetical protein